MDIKYKITEEWLPDLFADFYEVYVGEIKIGEIIKENNEDFYKVRFSLTNEVLKYTYKDHDKAKASLQKRFLQFLKQLKTERCESE